MARKATSLGPKPSLFVFVVFVLFFVLFFVCFLFCFLFMVFLYNKPGFPPGKGIFCLFSVFLFLSPLAFFGLPSFSVSLSLFLFLCLSLFFISFFLLVFPFYFLLVPCFCLFLSLLSSLLFFHERNNIKILNCKFCLHQYLLFFGFLSFCFKFLFLIFAIS